MVLFSRAKNRFWCRAIVVVTCLSVMMVFSTGAKAQQIPSKVWSKIQVDHNPTPVVKDKTPVSYKQSPITLGAAAVPNNPDVAVTTATNTTQSENSVFVSPTNPQIVLNSNNSSDWPVSRIFGSSYWVSTNGGSTWTGSTAGAGGTNSGDPATAIDLNGRMYINYISATGGIGASYSTNNGSTWTARTVSSKGSLDKNHMWVDNSTTSAFSGRLYSVWTNFLAGDPNVNNIELSRSTDAGVTWSSAVNISSAVNAGSHNQGVNVQTGPNGEVYAVWAIYDSWPSDESALGFAKSTNGGVTWSAATRIITNIRGVRTTGLGGSKTMRVASFPSMSVNQQTGKMYVVWSNIGVPGVNTGDADVYTISSTNGGTNWSTPTRVNQDAQGNGKDQWQAWIACDAVTGDVSCIFYDSRNFVSNNAAETFVAVSQDNGTTWTDSKVSDFSWSADGIVGFSGNYAGDYIGISARNGNVYPVWGDNHSGNMLTYVSPFTLVSGPVPPIAQFVGSPTVGCAPLTVQFTDQSTGTTPLTWSWTFGDGGTSTVQNPSHIYAAAGNYTVALTVTNVAGSNTNTKTNYITVNVGNGPVADFSGTPLTGQASLTVSFTDLTTNAPTAWSWNFGDGGTSTLQNPSHVYTTAGSYAVTLTASNACGPNTMTKPGYITVTAPPQTCDDFADLDISNWLDNRGTWTATGGYMNGNSNTSESRRTSPFGTFSTATIDCDVRMNTGQSQRKARILWAYVDGSNYRFAEGDDIGNVWRLYLRNGGGNTQVGSWAATINTAQWYHMKVSIASNGSATLSVGGVTIGSYAYGTSVTGKVGCGYNRSNSDFDNFCVGSAPSGPPVGGGDDGTQSGGVAIHLPMLDGNYPNPFNPVTSIRFALPEAATVTMKVYNIFGQEVAMPLNNQQMNEGEHVLQIDGGNLASGTYFYRLTVNGNNGQVYQSIKRMTLLK